LALVIIIQKALNYLIGECNYGGRVTDDKDSRYLLCVLADFYNPNVFDPGYSFSPSGTYKAPSDDLTDHALILESIMALPLTQQPEVFGLHDNAEITSAIGITNKMLQIALALQGASSAGGGGQSQDDVVREISTDLLGRLPPNFDTEAAAKKHPIKYEDSLNTVLAQELLRFNALTGTVRSTLINVGKAIKGEVPLSLELEEVSISLFNNAVPEAWHKRAYPSLKPLASWVLDFLERL